MASKEIKPKLGAESFSCPHCNAVAHHDWFSLFLKPENATEVVILTLEAAMLAKSEKRDELIEHNVLTYEYQEHPRTLKVKLVMTLPPGIDPTRIRVWPDRGPDDEGQQ